MHARQTKNMCSTFSFSSRNDGTSFMFYHIYYSNVRIQVNETDTVFSLFRNRRNQLNADRACVCVSVWLKRNKYRRIDHVVELPRCCSTRYTS